MRKRDIFFVSETVNTGHAKMGPIPRMISLYNNILGKIENVDLFNTTLAYFKAFLP